MCIYVCLYVLCSHSVTAVSLVFRAEPCSSIISSINLSWRELQFGPCCLSLHLFTVQQITLSLAPQMMRKKKAITIFYFWFLIRFVGGYQIMMSYKLVTESHRMYICEFRLDWIMTLRGGMNFHRQTSHPSSSFNSVIHTGWRSIFCISTQYHMSRHEQSIG